MPHISIKVELGRPLSGRPYQGRVELNIKCSPTAAPQFEGQGGDELSLELSKALHRSLLGGAAIDLLALSVIEGKLCWNLFIDGLVLSFDGNLLRRITNFVVSIAVNTSSHVCGITKRGGAGMDPSVLLDMIFVSKEVSKSLLATVDAENMVAESRNDEQM
ncbi:hypothetical protein L7F22_040930 [Adiantum nelumboides]|nr:hypothetical protein [Adiantum nelumboides]